LERVAVLASGGLDSSVLLADMASRADVHPLYVRSGLAWEDEEFSALTAFVAALDSPSVRPVTVLELPMGPVYGDHWSVTSVGRPTLLDPDETVYLPGRNILLTALAGTWCSVNSVSTIAIATLDANPFPDGTPEFFEEMSDLLTRGLARPIAVVAPYRGLSKGELVRKNTHLPLHLTLTCLAPAGGHCGDCNKCYERQQAFASAGVTDQARYAIPARRG
jgi:7-cyano-7-deazaguanine synthase